MSMTHFQRKSIIVVNTSARYSLVLRGTFFARTLTLPDLEIRRPFLKFSGISLLFSPRSVAESTNRDLSFSSGTAAGLPTLIAVEKCSASSSRRSLGNLESTRCWLEVAEFMSYYRLYETVYTANAGTSFILEELRAWVECHSEIEATRQTIYGGNATVGSSRTPLRPT